ncbi:MAG: polysaccharide deacetylase family protein [Candidatus Korobacteraceae bacterium]
MAAHELTFPRFAIPGVPVFMYHDVSAGSTLENRYTLPLAGFREHLSFLCGHGFAVKDLPALAGGCGGRSVVLTFDDGLLGHYERAFPALLERGMTATFFVNTALAGSPGYLSWDQMREMSEAGMTFGSHGREHIDYSGMEAAKARRELSRSRAELEEGLGKAVFNFSAPYGSLSRGLIAGARDAGFSWICSSHPWVASAESALVPRLAIFHDTDVRRFSALANRSALPLLARRARYALLHLPKEILQLTWPERLRAYRENE